MNDASGRLPKHFSGNNGVKAPVNAQNISSHLSSYHNVTYNQYYNVYRFTGRQVSAVIINRASHLYMTRDCALDSACGLSFANLNLTPDVFLRIHRFSSLWKFDMRATI